MATQLQSSFGPTAVALLALRDREFFTRLLKDPKTAVDEVSRKLGLTDDDKAEVVRLIESRNKRYSVREAQDAWEKFNVDGTWRPVDWPAGWPAWGRARAGER